MHAAVRDSAVVRLISAGSPGVPAVGVTAGGSVVGVPVVGVAGVAGVPVVGVVAPGAPGAGLVVAVPDESESPQPTRRPTQQAILKNDRRILHLGWFIR